jgi:hypothetical protein
MPAANITETMILTHALTSTAPAAGSSPKTVAITAGMKINQTGSRVASGISTITTTAVAIDVTALGGGILGRFGIKNLDGSNSLSVLPAVAGAAFTTLLPGEMAMGRFDTGVTAPAAKMVAWGTVGTPAAVLAAGGTLTVATAYHYVVTAVNAAGSETAQSVEASATPTTGNQTIDLSWSAVAGAVSYKVYRSLTSGSYVTPALAGSPTTNSFADAGVALTAGTPPAAPGALMEFLICEA